VGAETKDRLLPAWIPPASAPSAAKVMEALTPSSCRDVVDLERYEFLGDCVLKYSVACHVYRRNHTEWDEGMMTETLDKHVSNGTLFRCALVCPKACIPSCQVFNAVNDSAFCDIRDEVTTYFPGIAMA
jgi:dsRNA-specific ribonuclease